MSSSSPSTECKLTEADFECLHAQFCADKIFLENVHLFKATNKVIWQYGFGSARATKKLDQSYKAVLLREAWILNAHHPTSHHAADPKRDHPSPAEAEGAGACEGYWHVWPAIGHLLLCHRQVILIYTLPLLPSARCNTSWYQ